MDMNRETLLKELMAADFTVIELNLYLDTHPCDQWALSLFNCAAQRAKILRDQYERTFGPITPMAQNLGNTWKWIDEPWPWERSQHC